MSQTGVVNRQIKITAGKYFSPRVFFRASLFAFALTLSGCAQQPEATPPAEKLHLPSADVWSKLPAPPAPGPGSDWHLAEPTQLQLDGGPRLLVQSDARLPLVDFRLIIKSGRGEGELLPKALLQLLEKGSCRSSQEELQKRLSALGGDLSLSAGHHTSQLHIQLLPQDVAAAVDLFVEMLTCPLLPAKDIPFVVQQLKLEQKARMSLGPSLADAHLNHHLYPDGHPYAQTFYDDKQFERITRQALQQYHQRHFGPNNWLISVAGAIEPNALRGVVESALAKGQLPPVLPEPEQYPSLPKSKHASRIVIVDRPDAAQTDIRLGVVTLPRSHPDWVGLNMLAHALGGADGRLFNDLREKQGLAYMVTAYQNARILPGAFVLQAACKPQHSAAMLTGLLRHLELLSSRPLPKFELNRIRSRIGGHLPFEFESLTQRSGRAVQALLWDLSFAELTGLPEQMASITPEQLQSLARNYLQQPVIVMVGDADLLESQLEAYFPHMVLTVVDADDLL